jgi:hypothetical protein
MEQTNKTHDRFHDLVHSALDNWIRGRRIRHVEDVSETLDGRARFFGTNKKTGFGFHVGIKRIGDDVDRRFGLGVHDVEF